MLRDENEINIVVLNFHNSFISKALAVPLSMHLHQEKHSIDINGSIAVSSQYVGSEVTTSEPSQTKIR